MMAAPRECGGQRFQASVLDSPSTAATSQRSSRCRPPRARGAHAGRSHGGDGRRLRPGRADHRPRLADVEQFLGLLDRLVDSGKSVIVIEHHQAVMAHADRIIDLGPGIGHDGGRGVFEGTPADLAAANSTLTGEHLAM
jgi:hypothetical protein